MSENEIKVIKSIYALSDDIDYNLYEAIDIAEYAKLDKSTVDETITSLYDQGFLGECMSYEDDGMETYHLMDKALAFVEM
ncbi:MAG: hypothetical protein U9N52_06775 [Campylobacterota bacterium]|nr:hypothetical protein [Campylobacterota bacterium]